MAVLFLGADSKKTGTLCKRYPDSRLLFSQDPPKSERLNQTRLPYSPKHCRRQTQGPNPEALSREACHTGGGPEVPAQQLALDGNALPAMDGFRMRVLCRLPAVPVQASDQQGCFAPLPSHTYLETSHLQRAAINLCRRQAGTGQDRGAASKLLCPVCLPWRVSQALKTHSLPARDAPARLHQQPWGEANAGNLVHGKEHWTESRKYRFKSQLCH